MIASLQMYDWPECMAATDRFWSAVAAALAARGIAAPQALTRTPDPTVPWRAPDLLVGQTCGYPLALGLAGAAAAVARPVHAAEGCGPGTYRSAFVVRRADAGTPLAGFRGRRVAVNEWLSHSGFVALAAALEPGPGPFFPEVRLTGGHRASALAVARGEADIASLDCVSWALLRRHEPRAAERLAVAGWSAPAPSLPYITAPGNAGLAGDLAAALAEAARQAAPDPSLPVDALPAGIADYAAVAAMAARAATVEFAPGAPPVRVPPAPGAV